MESEAKQMTLCDLDTSFGKMSPELFHLQKEKISKQYLKKPQELLIAPYLYLDLREGYGNLLGVFWEVNSPLLGEFSMLNTGVSPNDAKESFLSQILEDAPLPKYYLSKTACLGILRRANSRDKELPTQLKRALEMQAGIVGIKQDPTEEMITESMICLNDQGGERMDITENITSTLRASMGGNLPIVMANHHGNTEMDEEQGAIIPIIDDNVENYQTLLFDNHAKDCRYNGPLNVAPTVAAIYGTGGNNVPLVTKQMGEESYCIASNIINRQDKNGGNGAGVQKDISYTLTTSDIHAIYTPIQTEDKVVFGQSAFADYQEGCSTIRAEGGDNGGGSENLAVIQNLVRRLTPLECERLQGFPDGWTDIPKSTDSPRYKSLGNSVAVPCVDFIMRGIAIFLRKMKREEEER